MVSINHIKVDKHTDRNLSLAAYLELPSGVFWVGKVFDSLCGSGQITQNNKRPSLQSLRQMNAPGCRPAVCSYTRSCQPQCSSGPLPGDWTHQSSPPPPLKKVQRERDGEKWALRRQGCGWEKIGGKGNWKETERFMVYRWRRELHHEASFWAGE